MRSTYSWVRVAGLVALGATLMLGVAVSCGDDASDGNNNNMSQSNNNNTQPDAAVQDDAAAQPDAAVQADAGGPPGHTENNGGHWHRPGKEDPLTNCTSCHGSDLRGGAGPSCYSCHNNNDHTINRLGHMHRSGSASTCNVCHGPNNTGGLGPACSTCH